MRDSVTLPAGVSVASAMQILRVAVTVDAGKELFTGTAYHFADSAVIVCCTFAVAVAVKIGVTAVFRKVFDYCVGVNDKSGRNCADEIPDELCQVVHKFCLLPPDSTRH